MEFYKQAWTAQDTKSSSKFTTDDGKKLKRFVRHYNGHKAIFYIENRFNRIMSIGLNAEWAKFLYAYSQFEPKCSNKSIKKALADCPTIYEIVRRGEIENVPIAFMRDWGGKHHVGICIHYNFFLSTKEFQYSTLMDYADKIIQELNYIDLSKLEPSIFRKIFKFGTRCLSKIALLTVSGFIGANLDFDLFDFDFGLDSDLSDADLLAYDDAINDYDYGSGDYDTVEGAGGIDNSDQSQISFEGNGDKYTDNEYNEKAIREAQRQQEIAAEQHDAKGVEAAEKLIKKHQGRIKN